MRAPLGELTESPLPLAECNELSRDHVVTLPAPWSMRGGAGAVVSTTTVQKKGKGGFGDLQPFRGKQKMAVWPRGIPRLKATRPLTCTSTLKVRKMSYPLVYLL